MSRLAVILFLCAFTGGCSKPIDSSGIDIRDLFTDAAVRAKVVLMVSESPLEHIDNSPRGNATRDTREKVLRIEAEGYWPTSKAIKRLNSGAVVYLVPTNPTADEFAPEKLLRHLIDGGPDAIPIAEAILLRNHYVSIMRDTPAPRRTYSKYDTFQRLVALAIAALDTEPANACLARYYFGDYRDLSNVEHGHDLRQAVMKLVAVGPSRGPNGEESRDDYVYSIAIAEEAETRTVAIVDARQDSTAFRIQYEVTLRRRLIGSNHYWIPIDLWIRAIK